MTGELAVGVIFSARPWRAELQRYVRDHVVGVSLRLVRDPRVGMEEDIDVMVVDDEASFLSANYVAALRSRGVKLVGVHDPASPDDQGRIHLERLGMDVIIASTCGAEELVSALRAAAPDAGLQERFDELVAGLNLDVDATPTGQLVAIGGPPGAGATEVAVAVAGAAATTRSVVLVDVDEVNPGVARRLGLGLHPHLLSALDTLHATGAEAMPASGRDPLVATLARPALPRAARLGFDVLAGLANRDDWPLAQGSDVALLLDRLRSRWGVVVVNLGPHLEDLSRYVDRFGASRAALGMADCVISVCEGSARGVLRYFDWLTEASRLTGDRPVHCLVNRLARSRYRRGELVEQLSASTGGWLASIHAAPEDAAVRRADWEAVAVGAGGFTRSIARLTKAALPPSPGVSQARPA